MKKHLLYVGLVGILFGLTFSCGNASTPSDDTDGDDVDDVDYCPDDDDVVFDDSKKYTYDPYENLFCVSGSMELVIGNSFDSAAANSMMIDNTTEFPYGTISVDVKTNASSDTGIVFNLQDNGLTNFWEDGISYYFFFLSKDGVAYLGKVDYGKWYALSTVSYGSVDASKTYNLKVIIKAGKTLCYINDEFYIGYKDANQLEGTSYGIRCGTSGVSFKNLVVTNDYKY
jgi:hypothetical protein